LIARILLLARYNLGSVFACQRTMQQAEQEQKEKHKSPKKPLFKRILKWLGVVAMVIVTIFGLAFGYLYTHQDKIKSAITETLNAQLDAEVAVGSIAIDFFSKFPEVSVKFTSVRAQEAVENPKQSLFLFNSIYVRFGIWDLIDGDYTIRKLSFDQGEVNLRILKNGENNWHFWKDGTGDSETETPAIALEDIEWNDARFRYIDEKLKLRILVDVKNLSARGDFAKKQFEALVNGKLVLNDLTYQSLDLADEVPVAGNVLLNASAEHTELTINKLAVGNIGLSGEGEVNESNQSWKLTAIDAAIREWLPLIPKAWRPKLDPGDIGGKNSADVSISVTDIATEVIATARLQDASLNLDENNIQLRNGRATATYRTVITKNKTRSSLQINEANMQTRSGNIAFDLSIDDLLAPTVSMSSQLDLQLEELMQITRPGLIAEAKGRVAGNFVYKERFASWDDLRSQAFTRHTFSGKLEVSNGRLRFENSNMLLKDISAEMQMRNRDLVIDRLFLREGDSEFLIDGWMYNALYLGANRPVPTLDVRLQSEFIDLNEVMKWQFPKRSKADEKYSTERNKPLAINFKARLDVKHFSLIRFDGYNLEAEVWNDGLKIKGKDVRFTGLDGTVKGNFAWRTETNGYHFWTKADLQGIDIHQLFMGFENFGQEWLLADNIYGTGSTKLETSMAFDKDLNFIPASFKLASDFTITNGRLVGYKPLLSLSDYVETKDLQDVRFDKLENQITIANQVIRIPQMEIKSSALNLLLLGRHSFDQQIDYSIRMALKDIIRKKKPQKNDLDDWIVEVETEDQPYIWVHVGCTVDDPCLSLDREMMKKSVKEEWKQQGEDIKNIFKPTTPEEQAEDPTKGELIFEWEEEEPDTNKR
jgi:uncharacterized membrane protein